MCSTRIGRSGTTCAGRARDGTRSMPAWPARGILLSIDAMDFDPQAIRAFEHAGWQRAAPRYGGTFAAATRGFIAALLDAARVGLHTRVLDVACGPGYVAAAAAARGAGAAGVDFSPAMLAVARAAHPRIEFAAGDAEALAHPDDSF